jgi:lysophospholipase L1-like esterase
MEESLTPPHPTPTIRTVNATQHDEERSPTWCRRIGAGVVIATATLVLLEIALRAFGLTRPVLYESDAATGFRLKPNQEARYLGNSIAINQWGVRDPRPLDTKPEGTRRLVVLGDSVTWGGIRMDQEDLFTAVMAQVLGNVQVINAGVNGFSVARMTALYDAHLTDLMPDTVIIYAIAADFLRPVRLELTGNGVAFPTERPRFAIPVAVRLARLLVYRRLRWACLKPPVAAVVPGEEQGDENPKLRADYLDENIQALKVFAESLDSNVRLQVVLAPTLAGNDAEPVWREVTQALDATGVEWLRLDTRVAPDATLFVDGVHLTTEGHRRVGEALAQHLLAKPRTSG